MYINTQEAISQTLYIKKEFKGQILFFKLLLLALFIASFITPVILLIIYKEKVETIAPNIRQFFPKDGKEFEKLPLKTKAIIISSIIIFILSGVMIQNFIYTICTLSLIDTGNIFSYRWMLIHPIIIIRSFIFGIVRIASSIFITPFFIFTDWNIANRYNLAFFYVLEQKHSPFQALSESAHIIKTNEIPRVFTAKYETFESDLFWACVYRQVNPKKNIF